MPKFKAAVKDANGVVYTLSDSTHVGSTQPNDPTQTVWFDTQENNIKVCENGYWHPIGAGSYTMVQSPTGMPSGYSVIEVDCSQLTNNSTYTLSFATVPPAGSVTHIILLPNVGGANVSFLIPGGMVDTDWLTGTDDKGCYPLDQTLDQQVDQNGGILFSFHSSNAMGPSLPLHITAISNGRRVYFSIDDVANMK